MVIVEELREKWPVREVSVYGNCIVIPDKQFKREWEEGLKAEGAVVLYQSLPGGTCALVRLKGRQLEPDEPTTVYQLKKKGGGTYQRWSKREDEEFMKRMGQLQGTISHRCNVLAREFNRSGLLQRYYRLRVKPEFEEKEAKLPTVLPTYVYTGKNVITPSEILSVLDSSAFGGMERVYEILKQLEEGKAPWVKEYLGKKGLEAKS